jgi:hypothetical protein
MPELSPAAQAVLDAANGAQSYGSDDCLNESRWIAAAALRAAADQAVPYQPEPVSSPHMGNFISNVQWGQRQAIRTQLLAIADELEAQ